MLVKSIVVCIGFAFCLASTSVAQENWPQWRGENWDNVSSANDLPVEFNQDLNMLWRFEMPGPGGASPVAWGENVFVTTIDDNQEILLLCIGHDGKERWRKKLQGQNLESRDRANSASPSPFTDGEFVWANSTAGFLECFDFDGNEQWSVDLQDRYGEFQIQFGMTSTPILYQDRIYLQLIHGSMRDPSTSQGVVVALDAKTGNEIWKQDRLTDGTRENKHSYASPTICQHEENECLVTHGGDYVIGHSLEDGTELWRCGGLNPKTDKYNQYLRFVASPICFDNKIVVPSAKNGPVFCLNTDLVGDVTESSDAFAWKLDKGTPDVATPTFGNGLIFLARENGVFTVVDAESGEQTFSKRLFAGDHRSSPVVAGDKVYLVDRTGVVLVLTASKTPEVLAENKLGEETTASPAIADNRIFIRTFDALYAFGKSE